MKTMLLLLPLQMIEFTCICIDMNSVVHKYDRSDERYDDCIDDYDDESGGGNGDNDEDYDDDDDGGGDCGRL